MLQLLEGVGPVSAQRATRRRWRRPARPGPSAREQLPAAARAARRRADRGAGRDAREEPRAGPRAERLRDALAPLIRAHYPDGPLRLQDLDQLVAAAASRRRDPRHFVAELVLDPPQSSADLARPPHLDEDYLVLSTIHSAKGLEWEAVHVLARLRRQLPGRHVGGLARGASTRSAGCSTSAMTRARRALHLYVPVRYYHRPHGRDDAHGYGKPSRFLTPEVLACCDVKRLPDDPLSPYGAPVANGRRVVVSPDALFD